MIYHLVDVERWFHLSLGEDIVCEISMDVPPEFSSEAVVAGYRDACGRRDQIVRDCPSSSTLATGTEPGRSRHHSLREILAHMIEEQPGTLVVRTYCESRSSPQAQLERQHRSAVSRHRASMRGEQNERPW